MKLCCLCSTGGKYVYNFTHILSDLGKKGEWAHVACIQEARTAHQKKREAQGAPRALRTGLRASQVRRSPYCSM